MYAWMVLKSKDLKSCKFIFRHSSLFRKIYFFKYDHVCFVQEPLCIIILINYGLSSQFGDGAILSYQH